MSEQPTIYVLYNAKASLIGKLSYGYRKICAPADKSPCAACDLTHGGLKLDESAEWKTTKAKIPARVEQLHQDELTPELREYIKINRSEFPVILGRQAGGSLVELLSSQDLAAVSKDHSQFLHLLTSKADANSVPFKTASSL